MIPQSVSETDPSNLALGTVRGLQKDLSACSGGQRCSTSGWRFAPALPPPQRQVGATARAAGCSGRCPLVAPPGCGQQPGPLLRELRLAVVPHYSHQRVVPSREGSRGDMREVGRARCGAGQSGAAPRSTGGRRRAGPGAPRLVPGSAPVRQLPAGCQRPSGRRGSAAGEGGGGLFRSISPPLPRPH